MQVSLMFQIIVNEAQFNQFDEKSSYLKKTRKYIKDSFG